MYHGRVHPSPRRSWKAPQIGLVVLSVGLFLVAVRQVYLALRVGDAPQADMHHPGTGHSIAYDQEAIASRRLGMGRGGAHKHLKVNKHFQHAGFDPEAAAHEAGAVPEDFGYDSHSDDWVGDEAWHTGVNYTQRLTDLMPRIDFDGDGYVSLDELRGWHTENNMDMMEARTARIMAHHDEDEDDGISLEEWLSDREQHERWFDEQVYHMEHDEELAEWDYHMAHERQAEALMRHDAEDASHDHHHRGGHDPDLYPNTVAHGSPDVHLHPTHAAGRRLLTVGDEGVLDAAGLRGSAHDAELEAAGDHLRGAGRRLSSAGKTAAAAAALRSGAEAAAAQLEATEPGQPRPLAGSVAEAGAARDAGAGATAGRHHDHGHAHELRRSRIVAHHSAPDALATGADTGRGPVRPHDSSTAAAGASADRDSARFDSDPRLYSDQRFDTKHHDNFLDDEDVPHGSARSLLAVRLHRTGYFDDDHVWHDYPHRDSPGADAAAARAAGVVHPEAAYLENAGDAGGAARDAAADQHDVSEGHEEGHEEGHDEGHDEGHYEHHEGEGEGDYHHYEDYAHYGEGHVRSAEELKRFESYRDGKRAHSKNHFHQHRVKSGQFHGLEGDLYVYHQTKQFVAADTNRNGRVSQTELMDLLYPHDSKNVPLQIAILNATLAVNIADEKKRHLGGVNKSTFLTSLAYLIEPDRATYTGITRQEEVERAAANVALFEALDTDKTGFLTLEKLLPIFDKLVPREEKLAHIAANAQMEEADDDKDGRLTLEEMLRHWDTFYGDLSREHYEDEEEDDYGHDETGFRR